MTSSNRRPTTQNTESLPFKPLQMEPPPSRPPVKRQRPLFQVMVWECSIDLTCCMRTLDTLFDLYVRCTYCTTQKLWQTFSGSRWNYTYHNFMHFLLNFMQRALFPKVDMFKPFLESPPPTKKKTQRERISYAATSRKRPLNLRLLGGGFGEETRLYFKYLCQTRRKAICEAVNVPRSLFLFLVKSIWCEYNG